MVMACAVLCALSGPIAIAQTPASSDAAYDVTDTGPQVTKAPDGWVGERIRSHWERVGRLPENLGNRVMAEIWYGAFVRKCPTAGGEVSGDVVFERTFEERSGTGDRATFRRIRHQLQGSLTGQVGMDGRLEKVEMDAYVELERTESGQPSSTRTKHARFTFVPDRKAAALPDNIRAQFASPWDAPPEPSDSDIGSLLFGIGMWFAGQSYVMAEAEWMNPNTCVEVKFEPDTRTQGFEPQRSYSVAASLQSKADNGLVPGRFDPVKERPQGQGSVTPTKAESSSETAARFVYRAGSTARANSGFRAEVKSRAGLAQAEWVLVNALSLSIEHRLWDDTSTATGQMGYALFSGTVKFDITLAPATNGMPHMLRGEATVRRDLQVGHGTGKCRGSGWEDEEWHVTAWLDPASRMIRLQLGFFAEVSKASWQCKGDVQRERELSVVLGTELHHLELSAVAGSTQQVSGRQRRANRNEELNVKVLSSPVEPAR